MINKIPYVFGMILFTILPACSGSDGPSLDLHQLFQQAWDFRLSESPLFATAIGRHEYDDRLPSVGIEEEERRAEFWRSVMERLRSYDRASLSAEDRLNFDIFHQQVGDRLSEFELRDYLIPITAETGFHTSFARLPSMMPFQTTAQVENYLSRLRAFPRYVEQYIGLMRAGIAEGMVLPRVVLQGYDSTIRPHIVERAEESVFFTPFENLGEQIQKEHRQRLTEQANQVILQAVTPGYRKFLEFMLDEYIPAARESIAASDLPNGADYYAYLIRHHTTLEMTADEVHRIGLDEVARIRSEMQTVIDGLGFEGDFGEFLEFLRSDPRFYPKTAQELLREASWIAKRMDGKLPAMFKTLPRQPYTVEPVPDHIAPKYTAGRYVGAALNSGRPGTYWVNTYALQSRPLYALTALTLHEAVPGHHLQNALRLELENLPDFRRYSGVNAFGEGWGLYSEWLGLEAGFYTDPYDNFGRLTYEMWRACRLVVDTGMHAKGWSRQEAMNFMADNTALSRHEITTETDRYISWPGQALAYKIGELKIRELRRKAREALGARFDLGEFHDAILLNGPVPLKVLENQIERWIGEASHGQ